MKLNDLLYQRTNDILKELVKFCPTCQGQTRKDDMVTCISLTLMIPKNLEKVWRELSSLGKKAVSAAYHNGGQFNAAAFVAQYGSLPWPKAKRSMWGWSHSFTLLELFLYDPQNAHYYSYNPLSRQLIIPDDMLPHLEKLVLPPERFQISGKAEQPTLFTRPDNSTTSLQLAENEVAGLHDLHTYLYLVQQGEIKASASTGNATLGSIKKLNRQLLTGDFFPLPDKFRASDLIRASGVEVFARESELAKRDKSGLMTLTSLGEDYFKEQSPDLLLEAFEYWTQHSEFDELSRLSVIKGQKSRDTKLTPPAERREAVIEALSWCPANVWISIDEFYRGLVIWDFDFDVEQTSYSNLYVGYKEHGQLYGQTYWHITKGLYVNVIIFEFLASIGAVDLLYVEPEAAYLALDMNIFYDEEFLSPYDGLAYFKINNLGAFLLGQAGEYAAALLQGRTLFTIDADLRVTITDADEFLPNDRLQLEQMAKPLDDQLFQLETGRLLSALETGGNWQQMVEFLRSRHEGALPDEVEAWLAQLNENLEAFTLAGEALFIRAQSGELAELALQDEVLGKFCIDVGYNRLVIPANKERALRKRLKELSYLLAE